jgi:Putative restriction endonuclease
MSVVSVNPKRPTTTQEVLWEKLPEDFQLDDEPVENTGQPLLAGALRESLELAEYIKPEMLIASNFALCATINGQFIAKAPDWVYVASILPGSTQADRKSYTPILEGDIPTIVMEFLSDKDGSEYSVKRSYPPGKWFFYEQILKVPFYAIFEPVTGLLEVYRLQSDRYELQSADEHGRYLIAPMNLFLGTWQGSKEERTGYWLRWWDASSNLLLWGVERIQVTLAIAQQERERADFEQQEKERLLAILRSQGIDPQI